LTTAGFYIIRKKKYSLEANSVPPKSSSSSIFLSLHGHRAEVSSQTTTTTN
jgi:hypothetical protein